MGSEGLEDIRRHTVVTSQNGRLKAWNKYHGIALNGEGWYDVRLGRLIITPDGIGKHNSLIFSCHLYSFDSFHIVIEMHLPAQQSIG